MCRRIISAIVAAGLAAVASGVAGQATPCASGLIQLPKDVNGRVQICGDLLAQAPALSNQLEAITKALGAQQAQLEKLIRGVNSVGQNLPRERQGTLVASLSAQLAAGQFGTTAQLEQRVTQLADGLDGLRETLMTALMDRSRAEQARAAIEGPVGDAIARLDLANATQLLVDLTAQVRAIGQQVAEVNQRTEGIQRTLDRQRWNAQTIGSALASADTAFLDEVPLAQLPTTVLQESFAQIPAGGKSTAATRFFENAQNSPKALAWLESALAAGLSPDLIVPGEAYDHEALLATAMRAANIPAVKMLLRHGANPNPFQEIFGAEYYKTRYLFPLLAIATDERLTMTEKSDLIDEFVRRGVPLPVVVKSKYELASWSMGMAGALAQQDALKSLGKPMPPSEPCCTSALKTVCARPSAREVAAWCASFSSQPTNIRLEDRKNGGKILNDLELRYLLDVGPKSAHFIGYTDLDGYETDYVLVEVSRDWTTWTVFMFTDDGRAAGPCKTGDYRTWCWRRLTLKKAVNENVMTLQATGDRWILQTPKPPR